MKEQGSSMWESLDEEQLIEAAKSEPDALSVLYRKHFQSIHCYVARRVATPHDVNDIVSEVFLTMVKALPGYRWTGAPIQAWLFRIASSQISRWVRQRKWVRFWAPFDDQVPADSADRFESEQVQRLRIALLELPCRYQHPLALFYLEDLSIKAIAEILNIEHGTVKARLSRGRILLRTKLETHEAKETRNERRTVASVLGRTQA